MRITVKRGGGNAIVWSCMAWYGVDKLEFIVETMNANLTEI